MRRLPKLWRSLEKIPGLLAVPAVWREECVEDYAFVHPHLRPTDMVGSAYPCPNNFGECPRKIVDYGAGEFAAICRDPYKSCETVPLAPREALLHDLYLAGLLQPVLRAASIRPRAMSQFATGVWSLGLSGQMHYLNQPVYFLLAHSAATFTAAVSGLLLGASGPFVITLPTNRFRTVDIQQRLQEQGIGCQCFEDQVKVDENGSFHWVATMETRPATATAKAPLPRSAGSEEAVQAVREYLKATGLSLTQFGIQVNTTDKTISNFLRTKQMRRSNFEEMAKSMGLTAEQLLRGELPASLRTQGRR